MDPDTTIRHWNIVNPCMNSGVAFDADRAHHGVLYELCREECGADASERVQEGERLGRFEYRSRSISLLINMQVVCASGCLIR